MIEVWLGFKNFMLFKAAVPRFESQTTYFLQAFCCVVKLRLLLSLKSFLRDIRSGTVGNSSIQFKTTRKPHLLNRLLTAKVLVKFQKIYKFAPGSSWSFWLMWSCNSKNFQRILDDRKLCAKIIQSSVNPKGVNSIWNLMHFRVKGYFKNTSGMINNFILLNSLIKYKLKLAARFQLRSLFPR